MELHMHTVVLRCHAHQVPFPSGNHVYHLARILLRHIYGEKLDWLALTPVYLLYDNLGLTYLKLIALAAHCFNKHRKVQHTSAINCPYILMVSFGYTQRKVSVKFFGEAVADMAGSNIFSIAPEEGAVVDSESH